MNWSTFKQMVSLLVKTEAQEKAKAWRRDAARFLRKLADDIENEKENEPDGPQAD